MTTITTADLRRSFPRRIRRNAIAALAAAALYTPTAFIVGQINNDNPHRTAAPMTTTALNAGSTALLQSDTTPVPSTSTGLANDQPGAADACGGEFGWVCAYPNHDGVESVGNTSTAAATTEPCGVGLGWWCTYANHEVGEETLTR